jgi:sialidase-1
MSENIRKRSIGNACRIRHPRYALISWSPPQYLWMYLLFSFLLIAGACTEEENPVDNVEMEDIPMVFISGEEGYACYRSPAMVISNEGTILAFCEGRLNNCNDEGDIDVVLKRSTDGGITWDSLQTLVNDGINNTKDCVPVVLASGRILLIYSWNKAIPSEEDRTTRDVFVCYSDDDGLNWSQPRNITSMVYLDNWGYTGTGPGHGIVKKREPNKGRIIIPARHKASGQKGRSHIIYSDDQGDTWHIGAMVERDYTKECTAVELSDGSIMLNSRNCAPDQNNRIVSISTDGVEPFYITYMDNALIEPVCEGSLLYHSDNPVTGKGNILFSNPHSSTNEVRIYGTLKLSEDDGKTWVKSHIYSNPYPAFSGYSDIALIDGIDVAVLFETGPHYTKPLRWEGIGFKIVSFSDINEPLDK